MKIRLNENKLRSIIRESLVKLINEHDAYDNDEYYDEGGYMYCTVHYNADTHKVSNEAEGEGRWFAVQLRADEGYEEQDCELVDYEEEAYSGDDYEGGYELSPQEIEYICKEATYMGDWKPESWFA